MNLGLGYVRIGTVNRTKWYWRLIEMNPAGRQEGGWKVTHKKHK